MKASFAAFLLVLGITSVASATVTIQLAAPFSGGIPSNLANSAGVITDGMRWGIVVDTTGNGFANSGTSYDAYASGVTTSGYLGAGGTTTDDYYIAGTLTQNGTTSGLLEGDFTTVPGHGSILDDLNNVPLPTAGSAGKSFALVWFSTNSSNAGDRYGFFTDASFIMPTDGQTVAFGTPFVGNDPTRSATSTFASLVVVPEPSRMLLAGFGALGLMMRRRRSAA